MRKLLALLAVLVFASSAFASYMGPQNRFMSGDCAMMGNGPAMMMGMHDLEDLGLSPADREAVEAKIFDVQKSVMRNVTEMRILQMELDRNLTKQDFDLTSAKDKAVSIAALEGKIRAAQLECLNFLAGKVGKDGWKKVQASFRDRGRMMPMMNGQMMPMMGDCDMQMQPGGMMPGMGDKDMGAGKTMEMEKPMDAKKFMEGNGK